MGDLDDDGNVGFTDLNILLAAWGACPLPCPPTCLADLTGDCNVGCADLSLLLENYGCGGPATESSASSGTASMLMAGPSEAGAALETAFLANLDCWLQHHLTECGPQCTGSTVCPSVDPLGLH